ncbi:MAG: TenA family transcriptional regulator [Plesiomonas sp.]
MSFYQHLQHATATERANLLQAPIIAASLNGEITLAHYHAFLTQAFHHVRHTVPLLMAAGSRLSCKQEWLRDAIAEYIEEELGHQRWILDDIRYSHGNAEQAEAARPSLPIELMVAFLYDQIHRHNPLSLFGMVLVLEGTSVALATNVAAHIQQQLQLPAQAMSYLTSHGSLDQSHLVFFANLMDRITDPQDQADIIHAARVVYRLYGAMLHQLTATHTTSLEEMLS